MSAPSASPAEPVRVTVLPLSEPLMTSVPPSACRVRSAVPVSMAEGGSENEPPAISNTGLFTPETRLVTTRLSVSRTLIAPA